MTPSQCDEGHPACRNCQKSKRECLGYDPIFKPQPGPAQLQPASQQYPSMSHTPPTPYPPPPPQGYSPASYGAPVIESDAPTSASSNTIDPSLDGAAQEEDGLGNEPGDQGDRLFRRGKISIVWMKLRPSVDAMFANRKNSKTYEDRGPALYQRNLTTSACTSVLAIRCYEARNHTHLQHSIRSRNGQISRDALVLGEGCQSFVSELSPLRSICQSSSSLRHESTRSELLRAPKHHSES